MKRTYKAGDWIRIPLDASHDALGLITRACRSRLFGYFFAVPANHEATHAELKALRASQADCCALFGGAGIEDARWRVVATSVPFDRDEWPFPQFSSRGAFGRTWSARTYDPDTMQVQHTEAATEAHARTLPPAHFAGADEVEALLRERICGAAPAEPLAIYAAGESLEPAGLQLLADGGRLQIDERLPRSEITRFASFIEAHPNVELSIASERFDLAVLQPLHMLRSLRLRVGGVINAQATGALRNLHRLAIGRLREAANFGTIAELPHLSALELEGVHSDVSAAAACGALESLALIDAPALQLRRLAAPSALRELTLAHGMPDLCDIDSLTSLARLDVRDIALTALPDLSSNKEIRSITLRNVRLLRDLSPLAAAPGLRELRIEDMPQLEVPDFNVLAERSHLSSASIDVGSRRKAREIYRLLRV